MDPLVSGATRRAGNEISEALRAVAEAINNLAIVSLINHTRDQGLYNEDVRQLHVTVLERLKKKEETPE